MSDHAERPLSRLEQVRRDSASYVADPSAGFAFAVVGSRGFAARANDDRRVIDNRGARAPSMEE